MRCEIGDFVRDISKCLADGELVETGDLEALLMEYQTNRSNLLGHLFRNLLDHDCTISITSDIKSRISLLEKRVESIRRVRDIEPAPAPLNTADTTKITLLRSLSLHAQLLTRTSYEAEQNGYDQQTMHQLRAHLRAINEVFYLFEVRYSKLARSRSCFFGPLKNTQKFLHAIFVCSYRQHPL